MATLRNRNGKWHVQVRRTGHATRTRSFLSKTEAHKGTSKNGPFGMMLGV